MFKKSMLVVLFVMTLLFSVSFAEAQKEEQAVINSKKIVLVRKELSPDAEVIAQARFDDRFDVVGKGNLYVQVRTDDGKEGYISLNDCRIVEKGAGMNAQSKHTIGFVIILIISIIVGIVFFIRQQQAEEEM